MNKIGLFYGTGTAKTAQIGKKIADAFGKDKVEVVSIEEAWTEDFQSHDHLIVGTSTWFDGELPSYWDELSPEIESLDLNGKKIAIFGLGDQKKYPENFADGIGLLARLFEGSGAQIIGLTSTDGYNFERSEALRDGKFLGLVVDIENQSSKTNDRIKNWTEQLKKEFE